MLNEGLQDNDEELRKYSKKMKLMQAAGVSFKGYEGGYFFMSLAIT